MALPLAGKRDLVFLRVGDTSTHPEWIGDPATRSYDVWLDAYTDAGLARWAGDAALVTDGRGTTKFARARALLPELARYEAVWLTDDDVATDAPGVERLFEVFRRRAMLLAQPSLADPSWVSHEITRWNGSFEVRYTNFVETMCPLFSREALARCAPTFTESASAYGLDMVWSRLLGDPRDRVGMIDAAPVVHTREVGKGTWRPAERADPAAERSRVLAAHGVPDPFPFRAYGGVLREGETLPAGVRYLARMAAGAPPSVRFQRRYWSRTVKSVWRGRG